MMFTILMPLQVKVGSKPWSKMEGNYGDVGSVER